VDGEENYQACGNQNAQELPDDPSVNLVQPTVRPSARARAPHTDLQPCWTMKKEQVQESKYKGKKSKIYMRTEIALKEPKMWEQVQMEKYHENKTKKEK